MDVFDLNNALRSASSSRKPSSKQEHKYQFLNYESIDNHSLPHHHYHNHQNKGQYSGVSVQNNLYSSKLQDESYNTHTNIIELSQHNPYTNQSHSQSRAQERSSPTPESYKNLLNDQLLRLNSSRKKSQEKQESQRVGESKTFREKQLSVDLSGQLREGNICLSARQQHAKRNKMQILSRQPNCDTESLSFINVEQLYIKENMKRTFLNKSNHQENESAVRNTQGLSLFKSTFRVRKQQKSRIPECTSYKQYQDQFQIQLNQSNTIQYEAHSQTNFPDSARLFDEGKNQSQELYSPTNENSVGGVFGYESSSRLNESNCLTGILNEQQKAKKVDINLKLPQFVPETALKQAEVHSNRVFNQVLLKANLSRTQETDQQKTKSLDQKQQQKVKLRYSQCQPILWVDNSKDKQIKNKTLNKLVTQKFNNISFATPVKKRNQNTSIILSNSLVINQSPIFISPEIKLNYSICYGNNSNLIRRVMQKRQQWNEISTTLPNYSFRWQPTSHAFNFHSISDAQKNTKVFNHFEFHKHLSDKSLLLFNVVSYCAKNSIDSFEFMPISFYFDFTSERFEKDLYKFAQIFERLNQQIIQQLNEQSKILSPSECIHNAQKSFMQAIEISKTLYESKVSKKLEDKSKTSVEILEKKILKSFIQIQETHFLKNKLNENLLSTQNMWVVKPVNMNRGNGITVVRTLNEINSLISQGFDQIEQSIQQQQQQSVKSPSHIINQLTYQPQTQSLMKKNKESLPKNAMKPLFNQFIIQKYIEQPLLFNKRKFDIRIWVLVSYSNNKFQFYQSTEGWVRTSGYPFDLSTTNKYIHLTNNAIQKSSQKYGQFENGNSVNYSTLKRYINSLSSEDGDVRDWDRIQQKIRQIIKITLSATIDKINLFQRDRQFELFGYDFMLDQSCNPWLIEVNTNPCIEESSDVLKKILPRLIDDMFRLTIDRFFESSVNENKSYFPLKGYNDEDYIWEQFNL